MDLLFWKHQNPNIKLEPTRKQYYGKFCYKLVLTAFGGRVVNDTGIDTVKNYITNRISTARHRNYGGSWHTKQLDDLQKADIALLEELISIKNGYGNKIKIRVEEPWLQIYTKDEDTLKDIAKRFNSSSKGAMEALYAPESAEQQVLLEENCIIVKRDNGYKYKVFMRDGEHGSDVKLNLLSYLTSLGDIVKYPKATETQLKTPFSWIWGCYFYTNDLSIITALTLIGPGVIGRIHELKVVEQ